MDHRRRIALLALPAAILLAAGCNNADPEPSGNGPSASASVSASASPSGNGVDQMSAKQILDRAKEASIAAGSVRIHGAAKDEGKPFSLDLRIEDKNVATGFITFKGQRIDLIRKGSVFYIKGDRKFWKSIGGNEAADLLVDKYLKTTTKNKDFRDLAAFTDIDKLFNQILKPEGTPTKGDAEDVDGTPAIVLKDGSSGKLYVATEGEPYVLRVSDGTDKIDFDDYGEPVEVQIPPADQVIDVSKLK